jgi:uncharacterized integral membrane protein (TIGR00698 family)
VSNPNLAWAKGVGIPVLLAAAGYYAAQLPGLKVIGPLCVTLILGMAWRAALGLPEGSGAGTKFAARTLLRLGIVLLGARLDYALIQTAGPRVLLIDLGVIALSIGGLTFLARKVGLPRELSILMGFGTGICGASAVVAAATVARADEEATTLAVALMGILGTLGVLFYVAVGPFLGLQAETLGVLTGSTLHEVAQVIAGASPWGEACVKMATVVKLTRVVMLAPALVIAGFLFNRGEGGVKFSWKEPPIPYFVLGFLAIGGLNTMHVLEKPVIDLLVQASVFLMAIAMGAMGLNTDLGMIRKTGWKAVGTGLAGFLALFCFSLAGIKALGL